MQQRTVAYEFIRAHRGECADRVDERDQARLGQAGSKTDHVLLGDSDVDESLAQLVGERLKYRETEIAGEKDDALVLLCDFGHRADERIPHMPSSSSPMACAYCWSDIGM